MRINFITSGFGLSGGTKAIFELANNLTTKGHEVFVICSLTPFVFADKWFNPFNVLTKILRIFKQSRGCQMPVEWFGVRAKLLCVPSFDEKYIPDADIILATWWETAYFVKNYSSSKGKKFYFAQDYEVWSGNKKNKERARNSYNLGLKIIVNSTWLKDKLKKEQGVNVEAVILHAPNHNQFFPEKIERKDDSIRILMPYREERRKGIKEGLAAIELVKKKYPNIKLVLFDKKPIGENLGNEIIKDSRSHLLPIIDRLRRLYNSCDIFLYPTLEEGFGMPPMEAMACGIPVVTTTAGAIPEYTIAGKTALICKPGDVKSMAEKIIELIESPEKRKEIAKQGREYIQRFRWENAASRLEEIFKEEVFKKYV